MRSDALEYAVQIQPLRGDGMGGESGAGLDDMHGRAFERGVVLVQAGAAAVREAADAIAGGIGLVAANLAEAIDARIPPATPGALELETVQVSFGITLAGGVQALFTSQVESSAQVTVTLSRRPADGAR
jgi:hypothetical protein